MASFTCRTCTHPERRAIELALASGAAVRPLARKFRIGKDALHRHWQNHVDDRRKADLAIGPASRMALAARVAEESESVIDHYRAVRAELYALLTTATESGDLLAAGNIAGKLITCLDSMARLTGQLAGSPLVQINQQNNFFIHTPEFARFQGDLVRVLSRFPDARAAVIAEFERLESESVPALEHDPDGETEAA